MQSRVGLFGRSSRVLRSALLVALTAPMLRCGSTNQDCSSPPSVLLLSSNYMTLEVDAVVQARFQVPSGFSSSYGYQGTVTWSPATNSTLLAVSDHPCSVGDLEAGACALAEFTGQFGSANVYPSLNPGSS